ncbi:MAG: thymidine phosphorylase [Acholeplasmatales bacterium]|nr:thymidine phosphorylase [Acholeplasmatales bacterium]
MNPVEIIVKKRDGNILSSEEIKYMIDGIVDKSIPDYQASSFLMAIYFKGMTENETIDLTRSMEESGYVYDLSKIDGIKIDKHSTGGVGDKTSLVLGPILAALGYKVCKMSGRGLGHTGGTIDKLHSIDGFDTNISFDKFINEVNEIGLSIIGQSKDLVPADKLLYELRDVTGTVESIPLIASSIMSKKLALGTDLIYLDVKVGNGAFMKDLDSAKALANLMVKIGNAFNKKVFATLTNMDEPLGLAIGNSLEVIEAINTLNGNGPSDLFELCLDMSKEVLMSSGVYEDDAKDMVLKVIKDGSALNKLIEMVKYQGGDTECIKNPNKFKKSLYVYEYRSKNKGYIKHIDSYKLGLMSSKLGGGRIKIDDVIDYSVGIVLNKKVSDYVENKDLLFTIHYNDIDKLNNILKELDEIYEIGDEKVNKKLILDTIY